MRKKIGIAGLTKDIAQERLQKQAEGIQEIKLAQVRAQSASFKVNLEQFAAKYKKNINKDPLFRKQFNDLCKTIGVDPLASSKGFWGQLLGVGDFYYELAVQIVEICMYTRPVNGGLIDIEILRGMLFKKRSNMAQPISVEDIERSVTKLAVLGSGFGILNLGSRKIIQSVPCELVSDHTSVIAMAQERGFVSIKDICSHYLWPLDRAHWAVQLLLSEGILWIDEQVDSTEPQLGERGASYEQRDTSKGEVLYWLPCVQAL